MKELIEAIRQLTNLFDQMGFSYAVMGGFAVRAYGIPPPTYDVDFTLVASPEQRQALFQSLIKNGFTVPEPYLRGWVDRVADMPLVKCRLNQEPRGLDLDIFLAESPFQLSLMSRKRREPINGFQAWFVSPEDLVLLKLIANRPRDIGDVLDILFTQGQLDETYLNRWATELDIVDRLERVLAEFRSM